MPALYNLLLLVHILAVVAWVGSVITIGGLTAVLVRRRDHEALSSLLRTGATFGPAVAGPAAGLTLIAGIAMMATARLEPQLWMVWGFASIALSIAIGAGFIRRAVLEVMRLAGDAAADAHRLVAAERHLVLLNSVNIALLVSAIVAMVLKPTF